MASHPSPGPAQKYSAHLFRCHSLVQLDQISDLGVVLVLRGSCVQEPDRILTVHDRAHSKEERGQVHQHIMH